MRPKHAPAFFVPIVGGPSGRCVAPAIALLVVAVLLGGGHVSGPIRNGLIESFALVTLLMMATAQGRAPVLPPSANGPMWLFAALFSLLLLQSVPLPGFMPAGRAMTDAVSALSGVPIRARSISLDTAATARMASSLLVPLAMGLLTILAGQRGRILLIRAIVILAAASSSLGMIQLALGFPAWASPFGDPDPGFADGLFVNRNHQAMFLLCGLIAAGLWIRLEGGGSKSPFRLAVGRRWIHAAWALIPLLILMVFAAGSKAGISLLVVALPFALLLALGGTNTRRSGLAYRWPVGVALGCVLIVLFALVRPDETGTSVRERMISSGLFRADLLPDAFVVLRQYWPWGSGAGTFVPVYMGIEDLDRLGPAYLNHVHNDYVEWLIEAGVAGLALLVGAAALLTARLWSVLSSPRAEARKQMAVAGAAIILLLALHSAVDYPLRTDALAAVFGVALGLVFAPALDPAPEPASAIDVEPGRRASFAWAALIVLLGAAMTLQIVRLRLAEVAAGDANGALAAAIRTRDGMALGYAAEASLAAGQPALARQQALAAIDHSPLSIVAVRTLASAEQRLGNRSASRNAWRAAAGMGWRDVPTQYWAMQQALADHEDTIAGLRADALLRLNGGSGPFADLTRKALNNPVLRRALLPRAVLRPLWREAFFGAGKILTREESSGLNAMLLELQRTAAPPTTGEIRDTVLELLRGRRVAEAQALDAPFAARRTRDPGSILSDGGFDRPITAYGLGSSPFDWTIWTVGVSTATLDNGHMVVSADGTGANSALVRFVVVQPGRYRLSFRMKGEPDSPAGVGASVRCVKTGTTIGQSSIEPLAGTGFQERSFTFDATADCPALMIGFGSMPAGPESEGEFDDVTLAPANGLLPPAKAR